MHAKNADVAISMIVFASLLSSVSHAKHENGISLKMHSSNRGASTVANATVATVSEGLLICFASSAWFADRKALPVASKIFGIRVPVAIASTAHASDVFQN